MRAAVYARYSSESQRPESIEDQIASCRRLAKQRDFSVLENCIFADYAVSGSRTDRHALNELLAAGRNREFDVVLVDDLSRLARDNFLMLSVMAEFNFAGIGIISVADGLDSNDEESKLGIQIRGIFNELQLQDLKKKTLRGQIGQKKRGFSAGEKTFGYKSVPFGETVIDKKGIPRPEGYKFEIEPREAAVVIRVFTQYKNGQSVRSIVKALIAECVPGHKNQKTKWASSTVSRILDNEKYIGKWVWNKTESRRDPKTGRRRRFPKPESEWIVNHDETLRIIPQQLWDEVQARRESSKKAWPGEAGKKGFSSNQKSRSAHNPAHLLSGSMKCASCGSTITQVSGKSGGYYGCLRAQKGACSNKVIVQRTLTEKIILEEVSQRLSSPDQIHQILTKIEKEIGILYSIIPESIRRKEIELNAEERRLSNFIEFIGEGRGSSALAKALENSEIKVNALQSELEGLQQTRDKVFQAPPIDWIEEKLTELSDVLEQNTAQSAEAIRQVLGPIRMEATYPETGKPYYIAHTSIDTLAIIDKPAYSESSQKSSDTLRWWARKDSNLRPMDYESTALTD